MKVVSLPGNRQLSWSSRPLVMGVINCTLDSFFAGSRAGSESVARESALRMITAGADILDLGGESSRPGSDYVSVDAELQRVVPVVESIRRESGVPLSVDTRKAVVARAALDAGADMINDISALRDDAELARLVAERRVPVVLMHMRGTPRTMQQNPQYDDTVGEIAEELRQFADGAQRAGVQARQIILDPGIGFGKRVCDNLRILAELDRLQELGYPLLIGLSRKAFLGAVAAAPFNSAPEILGAPYGAGEWPARPSEERLAATLAANVHAATAGVAILRVHDVAETVDACKVVNAIQAVTGKARDR